MSPILGPDNKPVQSEPKETEKEPVPKNGKSDKGFVDPRVVPFGTLVYNLDLAVFDEKMAGMAVANMLQMKAAQKIVADPPVLVQAKEDLGAHEIRRHAFANELNIRMRFIDAARIEEAGLEVEDLTKEEEPAPTEGEHDEETPSESEIN